MPSGAKIQLTIDTNSSQAEVNLKRLRSEAAKTGEAVTKLDQAAAAQHLERFEGRLERNARAARYFGGETAALQKEQQMLRKEIERLIRQGMNPLDSTITRLRQRYDSNAASVARLTSTKRAYTATVKTATSVTAAFMRTVLPFVGVAAALSSTTRFIKESGEDFEQAEARAQKFAITYDGITDIAEDRAEKLAATFNYARSTMVGILAETGDILTGFGLAGVAALDLTEKAAYLGAALAKMSPNIGDAADATSDLTKLMSGEGESMKKWGVVVRESAVQARLLEQGLSGLTGEALLQAQAQARLEIAYEQSRNALANVQSETTLALDVDRRYNEAWKERREIIGEATTNFFTPIKLRITEQIEAWNEATQAKRNYDAALAGDPTADISSAIATQQKKVDDLYIQLEGFANPNTIAKKWFYEGADWIRTTFGGDTIVDAVLENIRIEEEKLQQLKDQLSLQEQESAAQDADIESQSAILKYRKSREALDATTASITTQFSAIDKLSAAHTEAGITFDAFAQKQAAVRKSLVDLVSGGIINDEHLDEYIATYREFLADLKSSQPESPEGVSFSEITAELADQIDIVDRLQAAYAQSGNEFDAFSRKQSLVLKSFEELAAGGADSDFLTGFIAQYKEFLDLKNEADPEIVPTSAEAFSAAQIAIDKQIASIDALAAAHAQARIEFDAFTRKQAAVRKMLTSLVEDGIVNDAHLEQFIAQYREILSDLPDDSAKPNPDFSAVTNELENQISSIERLSAAYVQAGGEFDGFTAKQRAVKSTLEELIETGAETDFMDAFIANYQEFLTLGEKSATIAEVLSSIDEQAFYLRKSYADLGEELSVTDAKTMVLEQELSRLAAMGNYTAWELYQIELALKSLQEESGNTIDIWEELSSSMVQAFGGSLENMIGSLGSGDMNLAATAENLIDSLIGSAADAAMTAFPQFAPLIALGEGAVKGLNEAIFGTITASREAQEVIDSQHESVRDIFLDILNLEEDLSQQRLDAIREQMDLLSDQHDLEIEILKDRWQRGEITGEQYFSQAMAANTAYQDEQSAYEHKSSLIEGIQGSIDSLQGELDGLSGWTKFWTQTDEKLEDEITRYSALLAAIRDAEDLSEEDIRELAHEYDIDIPGAARGADFITSGPGILAVGDNPGGREHVRITPLSSYNAYSPGSGRTGEQPVIINITGDVYGMDDLYARLDTAGKRLQKLGRLPA